MNPATDDLEHYVPPPDVPDVDYDPADELVLLGPDGAPILVIYERIGFARALERFAMTPPPPSSPAATLDTMAKCHVAYCAGERPCPAHDPAGSGRPWSRARRRPRARTLPPATRRRIIADHGQRCAVCDRWFLVEQFELDHEVPLAEGGPDTPANLRPVCRPCHADKMQAEAAAGRARARGAQR